MQSRPRKQPKVYQPAPVTWDEMMAEARARAGEYQPPAKPEEYRMGRPLTDPFPGRPMEFYVRADVEAWLKARVARVALTGARSSLSIELNEVMRTVMMQESSR